MRIERRLPIDGVEIEYEHQGWHIWCEWPHRSSRHDIVTNMRIRWQGLEPRLVMSKSRINILSRSAVEGVIRAMKQIPDTDPAELVHEICEDLHQWYQQGHATTHPTPNRTPNSRGWLIYPIWPKTGITGVVASYGSYKSFTAQAAALQVATGVELLAGNTRTKQTGKVLYLDWEADQDTFAHRLAGLCDGYGLDPDGYIGYKQMKSRLTDSALGLSEEIMRSGYEAVVVDSMSAAIGGGMVDDDIVNAFYDAVRVLGVPAWVIAHKSVESATKRKKRFFGSSMSENRVRMAWNVERAENTIVWDCFKDNNHGKLGATLAWNVELEHSGDEDDETIMAVRFSAADPHRVVFPTPEGLEATVADDIEGVLIMEGPLLAGEIATKLRKPQNNIRAQLSRHKERFEALPDGRWGSRVAEHPDPY